jgi:hypothetical protein
MKRLLLLLTAALPLHAATTIVVSAKFADVPAGTELSSTSKLEKIKGVNVLSAPTLVTNPGQKATIEVTQPQSAPGGASVPLGLTLEITPSLGEKNITFIGKATDRAMHGKRSDGALTAVEFATREVYFSGATSSGETVVVHTAAAVSKASTKGAEAQTRELVMLLTFTKKTTEPEPTKKKAPEKTPAKKPAPTKVEPVKKKKK